MAAKGDTKVRKPRNRASRKAGGKRRFLRRGDIAIGFPWFQKKGLVACLVLLGFTLLVFLASVFGEQGVLKVRQMNVERTNLERQVAELERETDRLKEQVQEMQSNTYPYESAARERLGMVHPGEVVYDFRSDPLERNP